MFILYLLILLLTTVKQSPGLSTQSLDDGTVTVDIPQGTLKGRSLTTVTGVPYYSFQGIPYAQPPVGELRFKAPQPPLPWEGVRDATKESYICAQFGLLDSASEDCLFLNVYTPQLPSETESPNLSVMFWIHGGGFTEGSGNSASFGPDFLIDKQDIILVTINYRLSIFGFYGLDHPKVSRNNGLKDQVAALQWVHNNIAKFGGNPDDVTIFGESAGAASVHYQLLSPLSEGLFQKAIAQSGSVLDSWALVDPDSANQLALDVGEVMSYNASDASELLDKLLLANTSEIMTASVLVALYPDNSSKTFLPTTEHDENAFLPDAPLNLIKAGKFHQVPFITGVNSAEAKYFIIGINSSSLASYEENFEALLVPADLGLEKGSPESVEVAARIKEAYFGNESISADTLAQLADLMTDLSFTIGTHRAIDLQLTTGQAPVYFYYFSYLGNLSSSAYIIPGDNLPGAAHADDLGYLFKMFDFDVDDDSTEAKTRQRMTTLWTNFAKTGNPTLEEEGISWRPLNEESHSYISIDTDLTIEDYKKFKLEKMLLWSDLYKNIDNI